MRARVKRDASSDSVTLGAMEFSKEEWRQVPAGMERSALSNKDLECRATGGPWPAPAKVRDETVEPKSKAKS